MSFSSYWQCTLLYCSAFQFLFPTGSQEKGVWIHTSQLAIESPRFSPTTGSESWIENVLDSFLTLGIVLELIKPRFSPKYASWVPQKIQIASTLLYIWGWSKSHSPLLVSLGVEVSPGLIDSCFMTAWEVSRALPIPSRYCDAGSFSPRPAGNIPEIYKNQNFTDLPFFKSVSDPDPDWTRIQLGSVDPDPDPNWGSESRKAKRPTKKELSEEFSVRTAGYSFWGLEASSVAWIF